MTSSRSRKPPQTTTEAGYGAEHQRLRAEWQARIDAGEPTWCTAPVCLRSNRWIRPGMAWHLGHTPDRSAYAGPQHPECNCSEAGRGVNPVGRRRGRRAPASPRWRPTRNW